jgi:hypothetical protein
MIAILGIIAALVLVGVLYLLRSSGRMQPPTQAERMHHNESDMHSKPRPRATGLD